MRPRRSGSPDLRTLSDAQREELTSGANLFFEGESAFASEAEARAAWQIHGASIMAAWTVPLRRPRGWWLYDRGEPVPTGEAERLEALGELSEPESLILAERGGR